MSKHTPGPWYIGKTGSDLRMILGGSGRGRYVAHVQIHQIPRQMGIYDEPEREANAQLITAAPSLLAALEAIAQERENGFTDNTAWRLALVVQRAREAVALTLQEESRA